VHVECISVYSSSRLLKLERYKSQKGKTANRKFERDKEIMTWVYNYFLISLLQKGNTIRGRQEYQHLYLWLRDFLLTYWNVQSAYHIYHPNNLRLSAGKHHYEHRVGNTVYTIPSSHSVNSLDENWCEIFDHLYSEKLHHKLNANFRHYNQMSCAATFSHWDWLSRSFGIVSFRSCW